MTATTSRRSAAALPFLVGAVFLSGAAALIYETVWTRAFAIVLGSTVHATSATFAAFLVGLAAGAWVFGRRSPPLRFTVQAYLGAELAIALLAPTCGWLIHRHADTLAVWIGAGPGPRVLWAFGTVLLLVIVPTLAMGATFPLMLTAARRLGAPVSAIGRFYAINTLGAALGTLACGFLLIRTLGVGGALLAGAGCNALAAIFCLPLLRQGVRAELPAPARAAPSTGEHAPDWLLLVVAATSGALVLGLEVVWTRFGSYFLGNRTYAFTTLLACVLVLLAAGSWLAARLADRFGKRAAEVLGWLMLTGVAASAISAAAAGWWIARQATLEPSLPFGRDLLLVYRAAETFLLLAPPLIALGCLFPLSLMASRSADESTGRAAGSFYAANTAGSVVGSLAVGFFGMSALGAYGSVAALVALGSLVALGIFGVVARGSARRPALLGAAAAIAVLVISPLVLPAQLGLVGEDERLEFRREDQYGVMQVVRTPEGPLRVTNNRTELIYLLGVAATSFVQEMQGHLGLFHKPDARSAAVIGSGYGITAGALTAYPDLERIDAVEIVPGMIEAADLFMPFNHAYHRDPRVVLSIDDGRHFLARSARTYDLISINVSDPHLPGGSSLFHADFYAMLKQHMTPDGVVIQHAFGTGTEVILRTLLASFEDVRLYPAYENGYNVVAADRPLDVRREAADALRDHARVRRALAGIGLLPPATPARVAEAGIRRKEIEGWLRADVPIATDDRPVLEFAWSADSAELLFSNE